MSEAEESRWRETPTSAERDKARAERIAAMAGLSEVERAAALVAFRLERELATATLQVEGGEIEVVDLGALDYAVYRFVREYYDEIPRAQDIMELIAPLLRIRSPQGR